MPTIQDIFNYVEHLKKEIHDMDMMIERYKNMELVSRNYTETLINLLKENNIDVPQHKESTKD